nr:PAS domain-containing protein [Klebsiella variicola]
MTALPVGQIYRDREYLGDKFIAGSVYYNEFHHPNDLNHLTSVKLCTINGYATYLSLMTANTAAYPQPVQFELFRRLIPALKTACQLHARFEQLRDTIKYQSAVMDNGIYPVWLVDHGGKILYASAHAERYLRANARLSWYSGGDTLCLDTDSKKAETRHRAGHPDGRAAEGRAVLYRRASAETDPRDPGSPSCRGRLRDYSRAVSHRQRLDGAV